VKAFLWLLAGIVAWFLVTSFIGWHWAFGIGGGFLVGLYLGMPAPRRKASR
jgi:uncharacterized membrane protein